jgi:hypothetical protein
VKAIYGPQTTTSLDVHGVCIADFHRSSALNCFNLPLVVNPYSGIHGKRGQDHDQDVCKETSSSLGACGDDPCAGYTAKNPTSI